MDVGLFFLQFQFSFFEDGHLQNLFYLMTQSFGFLLDDSGNMFNILFIGGNGFVFQHL